MKWERKSKYVQRSTCKRFQIAAMKLSCQYVFELHDMHAGGDWRETTRGLYDTADAARREAERLS